LKESIKAESEETLFLLNPELENWMKDMTILYILTNLLTHMKTVSWVVFTTFFSSLIISWVKI